MDIAVKTILKASLVDELVKWNNCTDVSSWSLK